MHECYATLSYCWGNDQMFTLNSGNIHQFKIGIGTQNLSQTVKDAVDVAVRLGLRYLWIDALCILQDDRNDWVEQSGRMAEVYGQSWITIAAQESASATEGCIYRLPEKFDEQVSFQPYCMSEPVGCYVTDAKDFSPRNFSHQALSSRGWTFQERILARRTIFLCKTELKFECGEIFLTEHGCIQLPREEQVPLNTNEASTDSKMSSISTQLEAWSNIVADYNGRTLTYPVDKFPAIAGVASRFQKHVHASYIAGIWSNAIVQSLLFSPAGGGDFGSEEDFYRAYTVSIAEFRRTTVSDEAPS